MTHTPSYQEPEGFKRTSGSSAHGSSAQLELRVFEGDAFLAFLAGHRVPPRLLLLLIPFFLALLIIVAAINGQLTTTHLPNLWCYDLGRYLFPALVVLDA